MARRPKLALIGLLFAFGLQSGCGSGGGSGGPDLGRIAVLALKGTVEGYAYRSDGVVVLGNSAIAPPGATEVVGGKVQISGSTSSTTTDAAGKFTLTNAPAGSRTLYVTPKGGAAADFPVTVIAAATVTVGGAPLIRAQAAELVKANLQATDDLTKVLIMGSSQPIPAGVSIVPALGDDNGNPNPALEIKPTAPSWFFYADRKFGALFQHKVRFYLVDAATGVMTTLDATSWPEANGGRLYADDESNLASKDLVNAPTRAAHVPVVVGSAAPPAVEMSRSAETRSLPHRRTWCMLIQGNTRADFAKDLATARTSFVPALSPNGDKQVWEFTPNSSTADPAAAVKSQFNSIAAASKENDSLFVFVSAHGMRGGFTVLDYKPAEDGSPDNFKLLSLASDIPWQNFKGDRIVIVLQSCFSGKVLQNLDFQFTNFDHEFYGKCITVMSSSDANEVSYSYTRFAHIGGIFTNALASALGGGELSEAATESVFAAARKATLDGTIDEQANDDKDAPKGQHSRIYRRATTMEDAVKLDYTIDPFRYVKGQCIALRRIKNGKVGEGPECFGPHLHELVHGQGITIDDVYGAYFDPNHTGCGFGLIVQVKK